MLSNKEMLIGAFSVGATFLLSKDNRVRNTALAAAIAGGGIYLTRTIESNSGSMPAYSHPTGPTSIIPRNIPPPPPTASITLDDGQIMFMPPSLANSGNTNTPTVVTSTSVGPVPSTGSFFDSIGQTVSQFMPAAPVSSTLTTVTPSDSPAAPAFELPTSVNYGTDYYYATM